MQNRLFLLMLSPVISKGQELEGDNHDCSESENKKVPFHRCIQGMELLQKYWLMKLNW